MKILSSITTKKLVWLAVAVVLLINAAIMGKVLFNRSEVIAKLQLSERELQLPFNYGFTREDSSKRVSLRWMVPNNEPIDVAVNSVELNSWRWHYERRLQLSDAHFASFNFPSCEKKARLQQKQSAWVLVEFNGQSYNDYVAQAEAYHRLIMGLAPIDSPGLSEKELGERRKDATEFFTAAKNSTSRLFVIDAAAERGLLEARLRDHPKTADSNLLILPAGVHAGYYRCEKSDAKKTDVRIDSLAVESLYIPKDLAPNFALDNNARSNLKFTAEINYGRLYEPWIHSLSY